MSTVDIAGDRFHQGRKRGYAPQAPRLPLRENPLGLTISLGILGALHHLAPEHRKP